MADSTTLDDAISEGHLGVLVVLTAVLTIAWLGLLVYSAYLTGFADTFDEAVANAIAHGWVFYVGYANMVLITIVAMMLFAGFYVYCRHAAPTWAVIGLVFVPVYGALNLVVYVSQITFVPPLLDQYQANGTETSELLLTTWLQGWIGSLAWVLNNLAYAILGIPSIIFGILLGKQNASLQIGGLVLAASGIASVVGFGGIIVEYEPLTVGSVIGGALFLLGLLLLIRPLLFSERTPS